jgi:hypothetical protein
MLILCLPAILLRADIDRVEFEGANAPRAIELLKASISSTFSTCVPRRLPSSMKLIHFNHISGNFLMHIVNAGEDSGC